MIAGILGASGYAGAELIRLLLGHPEVENFALGTTSREGEMIEGLYPNFLGRLSAPLEKPEAVIGRADLVFGALPAGVSEEYAALTAAKGKPYIDLSADFRFDDDETAYQAAYGRPYSHPELHKRSVYGLPEINREEIAAAKHENHGNSIIGNPGCYVTAVTLGAAPLVAASLGTGTVIADALSGVSGSGRELSRASHFAECEGAASAYKVGSHRHQGEIARNLAKLAARAGGGPVPLIFTPHLAPMNRGILATTYIPLAGELCSGEKSEVLARIRAIYSDFYRGEAFVRLLPEGLAASTGRVRLSNYCDISLHLDGGGTTLIAVSAIDNMVKGAAGQAIQNMNIIFGFDEDAGLKAVPALF
jgi:N-acetyl-gamma-glutamyl-phosphate reductase